LLTLANAQTIITHALAHAHELKFKPLCVVVLDARGAVVASASEDGSSLKRFQVASAKAQGSLAFNMNSRALEKLAIDRPHFVAGAIGAVGGALIPVAGGVIIRDANKQVIGAVGVSGDTSDNDEIAAIAGAMAAGLLADGG
jgi:uncharacterized protein GlcG (DUF336 family)